ncbi:MAG: EAL domain-containing protein [Anaerotignum sp.]|nr:EAL domain-containing protein [Anaerotignum sp.]
MKRKKTEKELLSALRESIRCNCEGFYLCYQPLIFAESGEIIGAEALLRWKKEPYGEVMPNRLIPLLEKEDCFFDLGMWILKQAVQDGSLFLKKKSGFIVNVNVSVRQMEREGFAEELFVLLQEHSFPLKNLCLELTERGEIDNIAKLKDTFSVLRRRGLQIAIDDFGTGTAALHLLRELRVDCLKIDRMFVTDIVENMADQAIVKAVIDCAKQLNIHVCLEGVESEEQLQYLGHFDAEIHQGYYYGKPMQLKVFLALL